MLRSCIICSTGASLDLQLHDCGQCQSALYCSKACQRKDWKKQHKQICKLLNVGHGDMQIRTDNHTNLCIDSMDQFEEGERCIDEDAKRFFKLFKESTFEGSRAAAQKMKKVAKRRSKKFKEYMLFHSLYFLVYFSNSEMLSWPNSPLLVMLQLVDPNVLIGDDETSFTLLHDLANLAAPSSFLTHTNQLILAKQLVEHGANVNTVSGLNGRTPLHEACYSHNVTNLDFVELLLKECADPNAQDNLGKTPMIYTLPNAPGAAKFLLNWLTTDANITTRSGESFLARLRSTITAFSNKIARPDNPDQVQDQFLLRQWRDIEDMLVERGVADTGITTP